MDFHSFCQQFRVAVFIIDYSVNLSHHKCCSKKKKKPADANFTKMLYHLICKTNLWNLITSLSKVTNAYWKVNKKIQNKNTFYHIKVQKCLLGFLLIRNTKEENEYSKNILSNQICEMTTRCWHLLCKSKRRNVIVIFLQQYSFPFVC